MAEEHPAQVAKWEAEAAYFQALEKKVGLDTERVGQGISDWRDRHTFEMASLERSLNYRFYDSVDALTCEAAIEKLDFWSRREPGKDIQIEFNSPGGSVIHGLALYDFIQELRRRGHYITTLTRGMAASMGGILLQAGDKRVMDENAHILIHEVSSLGVGKLSEVEDEVRFMKLLWEQRLVRILAQRSTLSAKQIINKAARKDWWFGADDALELGFVDEVQSFPAFGGSE